MAKSRKFERRSDTNSNNNHHGVSLHKLPFKICGAAGQVMMPSSQRKKEWEDAVCSVCMESPHNAVLLLCSSFDKGCRPFMCATSHRFSNCLHQYKKACTHEEEWSCRNGKCGEAWEELLCPLCRCPVKGWTAVEAARRYLNAKKRGCMQEGCPFVGNYRELRKHVKVEHPSACPRAVDPSRAAKWKRLENEREVRDVVSTIRSTMPGAIIIGDYVIERNYYYYPEQQQQQQQQGLFGWNGMDMESSRSSSAPPLSVDEDEDLQRRVSHQRARRAARLRAGR